MPRGRSTGLLQDDGAHRNVCPGNYTPQDSSGAWPVDIFTMKAGEPETIPGGRRIKVKAGEPRISEIDTTKLRVFMPGRDGIPPARIYNLPEPTAKSTGEQLISGEYTVQGGDTIFAPVIYRCGQPETVPALPMRMKDAAICNVLYLGMEEGLRDPFITCIMQDSRGNLWFGSRRSICSYDGSSLKYHGKNAKLSELWVRDIIEDRNGNLWIGTTWGLFKYDGKQFIHYILKGFTDVTSITETKSGNLWLGTNRGVIEIQGPGWKIFGEEEGLIYPSIRDIIEDRHGNIWAVVHHGLYKFDGTSITEYRGRKDLPRLNYHSIMEDREGNLWLMNNGGPIKINGKTVTGYPAEEGLPFGINHALIEDHKGDLWIAT